MLQPDADTNTEHIVSELAEAILGENWMLDYVSGDNADAIELVLL